MKQYVIALDQGTTSSRCILFDRQQNIVGLAQKEFAQHYPHPGWVEHDPMEIYSSQYGVLMEVLAQSGIDVREVAGIGITNQRETAIVWDKETGRPVYNAIVWQCRRTAAACEELMKDADFTRYVKEHTGLLIDAYFSATKIRWILDNVPGAREKAEAGRLLFGTVDTWLIWKLTGGRVHVTDYTNASRTMLYDIRNLCWDKTICGRLGIPMGMLPEVRGSSEVYGTVNIQGGGGARCRHCGRPAGGAVRPDLLCPRRGEKHLRHRLLFADEHRRPDVRQQKRPADHHCRQHRRPGAVCAGGQCVCGRRGGAVAAG